VLVAYLAVYRHRRLLPALLLLATVVLAHLYLDFALPEIAESLLYIAGTGLLYILGMRFMIQLRQRRAKA
jgi:hypothetical protein